MGKTINRKQLLLRGLQQAGLSFTGPGAERLADRSVLVVLERIAAGLRSDRLASGMKAGAAMLGGSLYSERQVRRALAVLEAHGVVWRVRARDRTGHKEAPAQNFIHPIVIAEAIVWSLEWRHAPGSRRPQNRLIRTPLSQPCTSGKLDSARVPAGLHDIASRCQRDMVSEEHTHTPQNKEGEGSAATIPLRRAAPRGGVLLQFEDAP